MGQTQTTSSKAETYPPPDRRASTYRSPDSGCGPLWVRAEEKAAGPFGPAASFVGRERVSCPEHQVIVHPPSKGPPGQEKLVEGQPVFVWGLDAMTE